MIEKSYSLGKMNQEGGFIDIISFVKQSKIIRSFEEYTEKIKHEWFHNPYGIHGVNHIHRVLLLCLIIAHREGLSDEEINILAHCSIWHDIGRTNDDIDDNHGFESYKKIRLLGLSFNYREKDSMEIIKFIISYHPVADEVGLRNVDKYKIYDKENAFKLYSIFKDADALDRCRIGDLDPKYLRRTVSEGLVSFAESIFKRGIYEVVFE